jgi:TrmH family RNA methyltransferase
MPIAVQRLIQSRQNARVKDLRAAFARAGRGGDGSIAIEGEHLVREALHANLEFAALFVQAGSEAILDRLLDQLQDRLQDHLQRPAAVEVLSLAPDVFASAVRTESPQGIAALVVPPAFSLEQVLAAKTTPLLVVSAGLQDPGNLGTLIRSAEAFGATGFVLLPGTVSLYNQKTLRASSGSAFRLPSIAIQADPLFAQLRIHGIATFAAVAAGGEPLTRAALTQPSAILLGNEGNGIPADILTLADRRITIPTPGPVESLNAAIAGSILLYEAARQRARQ